MSNDGGVVLKLRVTEALGKDVGRAFARMDPEDLQRLGLAIGEIVEVAGKRTTVCKAMPAYKEQRGQSRIQVDGLARENAGVALTGGPGRKSPAGRRSRTLPDDHARRGLKYIGSLLDISRLAGRIRATLFGGRWAIQVEHGPRGQW